MSVFEEVQKSVSAASWLTTADTAAIATAELLAAKLDESYEPADIINYSKALQAVLVSLGLTVSGRTGKAEAQELSYLDRIKAEAAAIRSTGAKSDSRTKRQPAKSRKASS